LSVFFTPTNLVSLEYSPYGLVIASFFSFGPIIALLTVRAANRAQGISAASPWLCIFCILWRMGNDKVTEHIASRVTRQLGGIFAGCTPQKEH
jgi:hypothetical protein